MIIVYLKSTSSQIYILYFSCTADEFCANILGLLNKTEI